MADGGQPALPVVRTTCPYCGVGCGVIAAPDGLGGAAISGDADHPANYGRLCSKGSALGETLARETRLLHPQIGGARVSWTTALDHVASELGRIRTQHGANAIAFYLSGQLLTEDYYVANKLAKGFIGTPHVDTNSRLCMASSVAGHKRAFGADVVPGCYDDLDEADLFVLVGSNTAWCHPILYQRIQKARQARGAKVVNIDPRRTATSEGADLHLSLAPGTDTLLWNGLLAHLADSDALDVDYLAAHTEGFVEAIAAAREGGGVAKVAFKTGLPVDDVRAFYKLWTETPRVVSCYSQGVNQSIDGTDKVNAIINCHLATGRIAKTGAGPLSLTGQPNAMGGREVGGLANMLAAHMGFSERERDVVGRFWNAPNLVAGEGLKAVAMFDAIARGEIKALWVMGTNPAVSLPRADAMRAALGRLEFFAVSEVVASTDTAAAAAVRLPARAWGEKDGTVTNSERRISRQRPFAAPAGEARPDWRILSDVATRLGWGAAFAYQSAADIFSEHAALSGFENDGGRVFNISGLASLANGGFEALAPVQWPVVEGTRGAQRVFVDGRFATPSGRARMIAIDRSADRALATDDWPLLLNTGRIRDQWHTMTRTGLTPRLTSHIAEPFAEIHPSDAERAGVVDGGLVRLETAHGAAIVRAAVTDRVALGAIFAPIHWSGENSSAGRIGALVHSAVDPISGQPDLKATPARIAAVATTHCGFALTSSPLDRAVASGLVYWSQSVVDNGYATTFALNGGWLEALRFANACATDGEKIVLTDSGAGAYRCATLHDGRIAAIVFLEAGMGPQPTPWLKGLLKHENLSASERRALLAGRAPDGAADDGAIVCVCHQVGVARIDRAIADGCDTSDDVGRACAAGTNCGSCLPEINRMLAARARRLHKERAAV
ncbi:MAG: nitrate reductase [Hyphomicrobium sp.]